MRKLALPTILVAITALASADTSSAQLLRQLRSRRAAAPQQTLPASKAFVSPVTGKTHIITHTGEFFQSKEAGFVPMAAEDDDFRPSSMPQRMVAKLSVAPGKLETFALIDDLRK